MNASSSDRIQSLDGIRGIAILLVVIGHAFIAYPPAAESSLHYFAPIIQNSSFGVRLFFILSGYLITWIICKEINQTKKFRFTQFFYRRAARILPAYLFFLCAMAILVLLNLATITGWQFFHAGTFTWNYSPIWHPPSEGGGNWLLGHLWTLSVEVQFYLIWPLLLVLCRQNKARWLCLILAAIMPLVRLLSYHYIPEHRGLLGIMLHTSLDGLMLGAAVALWKTHLPKTALGLLLHPATLCCSLLFCFILSPLLADQLRGYRVTIGFLLEALAGSIILLNAIYGGSLTKILHFKPLVYCGLVSYSWYLWQQVFTTPFNFPLKTNFILCFGISLAVATLSYYAIEKTFQRASKRHSASCT